MQDPAKYTQLMAQMQQALDNAIAANSMLETVMAAAIPELFTQHYPKRYEIQAFIATAKSKMVRASTERAANIENIHRNTLRDLQGQRTIAIAQEKAKQAALKKEKARLENSIDRKTGRINIEDDNLHNVHIPGSLNDFFRNS